MICKKLFLFAFLSLFSFCTIAAEEFRFGIIMAIATQGTLIKLGDRQVCMSITGEDTKSNIIINLNLDESGKLQGQRLENWGFTINDIGPTGTVLFYVEKIEKEIFLLNVIVKRGESILSVNNFLVDFEQNQNSENLHIVNYFAEEPCKGSIKIKISPMR